MGYRLYREVLDRAPADLTSGERLVLAVIADYANDTTREAHPGIDALVHRCGLTKHGIGKALQRLAARKIEIRVPLGTDKRGRLVFAHEGAKSRYSIPHLPERSPHSPTTQRPEVAPQGDLSEPSGRPVGSEWSPCGVSEVAPQGDPATHSSSKSTQLARAASIIINRTDASPDEAAAVVAAYARDRPDIRNLAAVLPKLDDDEIAEALRTVRTERDRHAVAAWLNWARQQPPCRHGDAGGTELHPTSGEPLCPQCRAIHRAAVA